LWRYYRNTHTSHSFERETRIEAQPVTGSDAKVKEITGTKKSRDRRRQPHEPPPTGAALRLGLTVGNPRRGGVLRSRQAMGVAVGRAGVLRRPSAVSRDEGGTFMTALEDHATQATPWHLRGNWAPVHDELNVTDLRVTGSVPVELEGVYLRTGPNPASGHSNHWFFGDGMVHGVRLGGRQGRVVPQPVRPDTEHHRPVGGDPMANMGDLARGTGNTHVMRTTGPDPVPRGGALAVADRPSSTRSATRTSGGAHHVDDRAPEDLPDHRRAARVQLHEPEPPYLHYIRIGADGVLQQLEGIEIPNMVMMHDFNVTQNHVVFMDLPVCFDLDALETGMPFRFNRDAGARLG
jgi:hypothetical protein